MTGFDLEHAWARICAAMDAIGADVRTTIEPPATERAVAAVEKRLGVAFPDGFRRTLLTVSRHVHLAWHLPESFALPQDFKEIFSGEIYWSLAHMEEEDNSRKEWVSKCFPDPDDTYDRVWHNKLGFCTVPNGDCLSIDLGDDTFGEIVYLSHDDGEGHGLCMAPSFDTLIRDWSRVGFAGTEDWQWLPFHDAAARRIDPDCAAAREFRQLIGVADGAA